MRRARSIPWRARLLLLARSDVRPTRERGRRRGAVVTRAKAPASRRHAPARRSRYVLTPRDGRTDVRARTDAARSASDAGAPIRQRHRREDGRERAHQPPHEMLSSVRQQAVFPLVSRERGAENGARTEEGRRGKKSDRRTNERRRQTGGGKKKRTTISGKTLSLGGKTDKEKKGTLSVRFIIGGGGTGCHHAEKQRPRSRPRVHE